MSTESKWQEFESEEEPVKVPLMPKGVEHVAPVARAPPTAIRVKVPLMPKGVEHPVILLACASYSIVKVPLMPKGVEHNIRKPQSPYAAPVKVPLMPKGVEHPFAPVGIDEGSTV